MLSVTLRRSPDAAFALLKKAQSGAEVADALEVPERQLLYILYDRKLERSYTTFEIPKKSGGVRTIRAPTGSIDILQGKVLSLLAPRYIAPPWVHGFAPKRGVLTNAAPHAKRRFVVNVDLEDFFDSINFGRVRGVLMKSPWRLSPAAATVLAQIVTCENRLPQGARTSPLFSNLVAWPLDRKLLVLAKKYKLTYSRYADDITFSSSRKSFPPQVVSWQGSNPLSLAVAGEELDGCIISAGFKINSSKLRVQVPSVRQEVTGLTVNEFVNVKRACVRKIRAMLNNWRTRSLLEAEAYHLTKNPADPSRRDGTYFRNVVYGHMAFLKQIRGENDRIYLKFCGELALLDPKPPKSIRDGKDKLDMYDFFICHASEDKDKIVRPLAADLEARGAKVFLDENAIKIGDSFVKIINHALGRSRFVVAVISEHSVAKHWPLSELQNVLAMEATEGKKLLPVMVGAELDVVRLLKKLPLLSDRLYHRWDPTLPEIDSVREAATRLYSVL